LELALADLVVVNQLADITTPERLGFDINNRPRPDHIESPFTNLPTDAGFSKVQVMPYCVTRSRTGGLAAITAVPVRAVPAPDAVAEATKRLADNASRRRRATGEFTRVWRPRC
jgi:hypothetical protein